MSSFRILKNLYKFYKNTKPEFITDKKAFVSIWKSFYLFFACFIYIGLLLFDDRNINMNAILEFLWFPLLVTMVISILLIIIGWEQIPFIKNLVRNKKKSKKSIVKDS